MIYWKQILLTLVLGTLSCLATAKEWACTKYSTFPVVLEACEGEGFCAEVHGDKKAIAPVNIYEKPFLSSRKIDVLKKGELIENPKPYLVIEKFGKVVVTNPGKELLDVGVKKEDTLPLVMHFEDSVEVCIGENLIEAEDLYAGVPNSVKIVEENKTQSWVQLKTPRGVVGYARELDDISDSKEHWYIGRYS